MYILLLGIFGIALLCAAGTLGYVIYDYVKVREEFEQTTPDQMFVECYRAIKQARLNNPKLNKFAEGPQTHTL